MKKLLVILVLFFAVSSYAQDIIKTIDGKTIEASIKEIGENSVVYKLWSNQDGPDFRITKDSIGKIILQSGEEYYYSPLFEAEKKGIFVPKTITSKGFRLYDGERKIDDEDLKYILNEQLLDDYNVGQRKKRAAITLASVGGGLALGCLAFALGHKEYVTDAKDVSLLYPAVLCGAGSAGCLIASIPLFISGQGRVRSVAENYNQQKALLSFGMTQNGVGIALVF